MKKSAITWTAVLSVVPPQGPSGPVRVLVAPEAGTDGLLASDVSTVPLRKALLAQLKKLHNPAASRALAHRAVYEPLAELRQSAAIRRA